MALTASRLGQINATGSETALFLKVWAGEVLTAFQEKNVMKPLHVIREVSSGKSAQFPATGKSSAAYHTPGTQISTSQIKHGEVTISLDYPLLDAVMVPDWDQLLNHYDYRSEYTTQLAASLARHYDEMVLRLKSKAARASATISGADSGSQIEIGSNGGALSDLTATNLIDGLFQAAEKLDKNDVPRDERYCVMDPAQYYLLVQGTVAQNRDFGGVGSIASGSLPQIAGINLMTSNNVPQGSNLSSPSGAQNDYSLDATLTVAPVFHRSATGTVQRQDVTMETERKVDYQSDLVVAKHLVGHGILRPESAMELILATA
jgi:hypothetical protein